jgi:CRP-like cAMP-binding protein
MKVVSTSKGVISEMYAGDTFGEGALLEDSHLRKMSVLAQEYPVAVLRIDKLHYDRYIKSFHAKEKTRREAVFREVSILDELGKEAKGALLHTMVTHRFKIGERLVVEGSFCTSLMFISSGHCRVTKQVPTPRGAEEVELGAFYSGSCLAAEATLGRGRCAYTVTAMSFVVVETLDAAFHIFCDHPIIDGRAQALLRAAERAFLLRPRTQAILNGAESLRRWREYKTQLSDHVIRRRRRELRRDAERFSRPFDPPSPAADPADPDAASPQRRRGGEGLPELDPPDRMGPRAPRDGRWPFFQPLVDRSAASRRMATLAADTGVLLKDNTFI